MRQVVGCLDGGPTRGKANPEGPGGGHLIMQIVIEFIIGAGFVVAIGAAILAWLAREGER